MLSYATCPPCCRTLLYAHVVARYIELNVVVCDACTYSVDVVVYDNIFGLTLEVDIRLYSGRHTKLRSRRRDSLYIKEKRLTAPRKGSVRRFLIFHHSTRAEGEA